MSRAREGHDPTKRAPTEQVSDPVDEASAESFPGSDPPGWIAMHLGRPEPAAEHCESNPTN